MSHVRGTISVDVAFTDSTTVSGAQSLKTITLRDATEYTSGKVAVVTGTCGTTAVTVFEAGIATSYKDAAGDAVQFAASDVRRVAVSSPQQVEVFASGPDSLFAVSGGHVAVVGMPGDVDSITVAARPSGTASYTLVLYGT